MLTEVEMSIINVYAIIIAFIVIAFSLILFFIAYHTEQERLKILYQKSASGKIKNLRLHTRHKEIKPNLKLRNQS